MRSRVSASSAPSGSSSSRNRGSAASARAIPTRWRMPPESSQMCLSPAPSSSTSASSSSARRARSPGGTPRSLSGKATLSRAVSQGNSASFWKTTARSAAGPAIGLPSTVTLPRDGLDESRRRH